MLWPPKKSRKLRWRSARQVCEILLREMEAGASAEAGSDFFRRGTSFFALKLAFHSVSRAEFTGLTTGMRRGAEWPQCADSILPEMRRARPEVHISFPQGAPGLDFETWDWTSGYLGLDCETWD